MSTKSPKSPKGLNQDAFSGDTPPPEKSLIPKAMLNDGIQGQQYGALNPMQQVIGLTPEQAKYRLQQQELVLKQQELNQQFLFRLLMTVGSLVGVVLLGTLAIFQFSPRNRANAYAKVAERTAASIGRPEIRVDCGFRLLGECDAGQMAERALTTYEHPTPIDPTHSPTPEAVHLSAPPIPPASPTPPALSLPPSGIESALEATLDSPFKSSLDSTLNSGPGVALAAVTSRPQNTNLTTNPRQTDEYRQARDIIHRWSQRGFGSQVVAGHYYWLQAAQTNPSDPEHAKALQQPSYPLFGLAYEDYYNLSI